MIDDVKFSSEMAHMFIEKASSKYPDKPGTAIATIAFSISLITQATVKMIEELKGEKEAREWIKMVIELIVIDMAVNMQVKITEKEGVI